MVEEKCVLCSKVIFYPECKRKFWESHRKWVNRLVERGDREEAISQTGRFRFFPKQGSMREILLCKDCSYKVCNFIISKKEKKRI